MWDLIVLIPDHCISTYFGKVVFESADLVKQTEDKDDRDRLDSIFHCFTVHV